MSLLSRLDRRMMSSALVAALVSIELVQRDQDMLAVGAVPCHVPCVFEVVSPLWRHPSQAFCLALNCSSIRPFDADFAGLTSFLTFISAGATFRPQLILPTSPRSEKKSQTAGSLIVTGYIDECICGISQFEVFAMRWAWSGRRMCDSSIYCQEPSRSKIYCKNL